MREPNFVVRIVGNPLVGSALVGGEGFILYQWYLGHLVWWLGIVVMGLLFRTVSAMAAVRRYKVWHGGWEAMGRADGHIVKSHAGTILTALATALVVLGPLLDSLPLVQANDLLGQGLHWAWVVAVLWVGFKLLRVMWRHVGKMRIHRQVRHAKKAMETPVALAVAKSFSSPTRASIEKNLPDYCRRLMAQGR
jgi:hypothetical protein